MSHTPRKRFGQNFLRDEAVIEAIASAIAPDKSHHLIEIGPGEGAITQALVASGCRFDAIELDRDLHLRKGHKAEQALEEPPDSPRLAAVVFDPGAPCDHPRLVSQLRARIVDLDHATVGKLLTRGVDSVSWLASAHRPHACSVSHLFDKAEERCLKISQTWCV